MKNDTTFVRMRSGDHLGDAKMSKKALRSVEFKGALSRAALGTRFCLFGGEVYVLSSFFIVLDLVNPWPSDLETSTDAFLFTWAS